MLQIFLAIQSLNPFEKFCIRALMIAINVSEAKCQMAIRQLSSFGKKSTGLTGNGETSRNTGESIITNSSLFSFTPFKVCCK